MPSALYAHRVESKLINMGQRCSDTRIINFGELSKNTYPPSFLLVLAVFSQVSRWGPFS